MAQCPAPTTPQPHRGRVLAPPTSPSTTGTSGTTPQPPQVTSQHGTQRGNLPKKGLRLRGGRRRRLPPDAWELTSPLAARSQRGGLGAKAPASIIPGAPRGAESCRAMGTKAALGYRRKPSTPLGRAWSMGGNQGEICAAWFVGLVTLGTRCEDDPSRGLGFGSAGISPSPSLVAHWPRTGRRCLRPAPPASCHPPLLSASPKATLGGNGEIASPLPAPLLLPGRKPGGLLSPFYCPHSSLISSSLPLQYHRRARPGAVGQSRVSDRFCGTFLPNEKFPLPVLRCFFFSTGIATPPLPPPGGLSHGGVRAPPGTLRVPAGPSLAGPGSDPSPPVSPGMAPA